jgi:hypothetical protein
MSYTTIDDPTIYFNTVLWTGDGNDDRNITGVGFQPDMVWQKKRNEAGSHRIADSVRGATNVVFPDLTNAEASRSNEFQSFISDGFQIGDDSNFNGSSNTHVAWAWAAGGSASSNSNGSITSSVSASTDAGFSIVSYTGTGSAATIGHGLGAVPAWYFIKQRNTTGGWIVYHKGNTSSPETDYLRLDKTDSTVDDAIFNDTAPTSSVFSIGTNAPVNTSGGTYIAYCFAEKKGYSKFGSYTGNGNADGTFIYTGFKPAFFLVKRTTGTAKSWIIHDNKRDPNNLVDAYLYPNSNEAEGTSSSSGVDFLSNGIKLRNTYGSENVSGVTFIYSIFAESPFVNSNGVPNNAR